MFIINQHNLCLNISTYDYYNIKLQKETLKLVLDVMFNFVCISTSFTCYTLEPKIMFILLIACY